MKEGSRILTTVSFTVSKVLEASALVADTQEPPEKTSQVGIEDPGRWRGISKGAQRADRYRLDLGVGWMHMDIGSSSLTVG